MCGVGPSGLQLLSSVSWLPAFKQTQPNVGFNRDEDEQLVTCRSALLTRLRMGAVVIVRSPTAVLELWCVGASWSCLGCEVRQFSGYELWDMGKWLPTKNNK